MKKTFLLILFFGTAFTSLAQFNNYNDGDEVNDFTVTDVYGNTHNLYNYTAAGKYVYMDFFYSACGGCQGFMPIFNELYDKYGCNEGDLICISMNSGYDKDAEVITFENNYGGSFHHAPAIGLDGDCEAVIVDFDPIYYPAVCLIAPDNTMVNAQVTPYNSIEDLEAAFPSDFNPEVMNCTIGLDDYDSTFSFSIFPNPSDGKEINIHYSGEKATLKIFNILGKEVFVSVLSNNIQKVFPNLSKGAYIISIQTKDHINSKKLIVK